jgi:cellulose synthase/poly-beta-1,6-N-acetylglucosamine synthase-like glycosyltransferase
MVELAHWQASDPAPRSGPDPAGQPRIRLGEALVTTGHLDPATVEGALALQRQIDAPLGRILVSTRALTRENLVRALGAQARLPVVDLREAPPDPALLAGLDPHLCLGIEAIPWRRIGSTLIIAIGRPEAEAIAEERLARDGTRCAFVLADADAIRAAIAARFADRLRREAARRCPGRYSCRELGGSRARRRAILLMAALAAGLHAAPALLLAAALAWLLVMNAMTTGLRLVALVARLRMGRPDPAPAVPRIADARRLPTISLLVPLKGEATIAARLVAALEALDYPRPLLDVKIILEEDDLATRLALEAAGLPEGFEILTVPRDPALQTKPRALNYALPFCRGSIVGVYDAEDRPEPGQLRAVAEAFARAPREVACVQGYLDFYNDRDNWLARCFTIEYAIWFRILLHGIQRLGLPIPLGGTTLFFRRRALEAIGGWDAHNVTEDADLGMRLARFGYRCEMIASVTLEEANCRPWRWIGQRSRWLKGYAMTWLTHMRSPRRLLRDLGWRGFLGFQVLFLGGMTSYLAIPLFWVLFLSAGLGTSLRAAVPDALFWGFVLTTIIGQAAMLAIAAMALRDAGRLAMLPWLAMLPFYWPLGAVAAYRALLEIVTRPFHWTKTEHGLAREGR